MKRINLFIACIALCFFCSCTVGRYVNNSTNLNLNQTQVILSSNNFRVVRIVTAYVEYDGKLTSFDEEQLKQNAYASLLRKAQLKGAQMLVNVTLENVQMAKSFFSMTCKLQNAIMAQGLVIEFVGDSSNIDSSLPVVQSEIAYVPSSKNEKTQVVEEPQVIARPVKVPRAQIEKNKWVRKYFNTPRKFVVYQKLCEIIDFNENDLIEDSEFDIAAMVMNKGSIESFLLLLSNAYDKCQEDSFLDVLKSGIEVK